MSVIQTVVSKVASWLRRNKIRREIVVNVEKLETRVAVMENGRLEEFMVEHPEDERLVGCVFKGRIQNLQDDLQAAFVDIGLKKNAFLHYWDMQPDFDAFLDEIDDGDDEEGGKNGKGKNGKGKNGKGKNGKRRGKPQKLTNEQIHEKFKPGSEIIVQVTKGPISTKGPRVTTNLSIPGRYLVMMPGDAARGVSRKIGDAEERKRLKKILDRLLVPEEVGLIVRTAGVGAKGSSFARDMRNLLESWHELQANVKNLRAPCCVWQEPDLVERVVRDWLTEDIDNVLVDDEKTFEKLRDVTSRISRRARGKVRRYEGADNVFERYGIERQLRDAFNRQVKLKSGGYLVIDETEALIAVDVNTGHHKGKGSQEEAILEVNLEAVEEVARQLRLRNIGGLVVLDLIDMKSRKHQKQVYRALKDALKRDRVRTNVLEISELGLLEMSRQRHEESILSMLSSTCPCCSGHGVVKSPLAISIELQRQLTALLRKADAEKRPFVPKIVISPAVMQRLRTEDAQILAQLQAQFNTKLTFVSELHRHPESYSILDAESGQVLYSASAGRPAV
ncbi:MAG: Rne/Rng family ribonuclease [Kiritimatiellae bacterium]|nr:Rne/Rng family ribonuclease [Kiritimatiellia bacterium]